MLFSSAVFVLAFLPVTYIGYAVLTRSRWGRWSASWLMLASLFFYGYWKPLYLVLIAASIVANFNLGKLAASQDVIRLPGRGVRVATLALAAGIVFNLSLLGYFKYADFAIETWNALLSTGVPPLDLVLPLAISFFTFQQIAYLVDVYRAHRAESAFTNYCLFVSFFPQLIAGPIVHHKEMMPQFAAATRFNWNYFNAGLTLFIIGLFKKLALADSLAVWANSGYAAADRLSVLDAWRTTLSYTFQLYFDFSGYSDMAIGLGLLFMIRLPENFDSPYQAASIREFWRRWHMTLSRWLRDYVYAPLGGNRRGPARTYLHVLITFVLGGLWHGAGWVFVVWGALHGLALCAQRLWHRAGVPLPHVIAVALTFLCVHLGWVFFRSVDVGQAVEMAGTLFGLGTHPSAWTLVVPPGIEERFDLASSSVLLAWSFGIVFVMPNSMELVGYRQLVPGNDRVFTWPAAVGVGLLAAMSLAIMTFSRGAEFLYFNF